MRAAKKKRRTPFWPSAIHKKVINAAMKKRTFCLFRAELVLKDLKGGKEPFMDPLCGVGPCQAPRRASSEFEVARNGFANELEWPEAIEVYAVMNGQTRRSRNCLKSISGFASGASCYAYSEREYHSGGCPQGSNRSCMDCGRNRLCCWLRMLAGDLGCC